MISDALKVKEQGDIAFRQGNYVKSLEDFSNALAAMHGCEQSEESFILILSIFTSRAAALLELGNPKLALEDCNMGLSLDPSDFDLRFSRAAAFLALGDKQKSLDQLSNIFTDGIIDENIRAKIMVEFKRIESEPEPKPVITTSPVSQNETPKITTETNTSAESGVSTTVLDTYTGTDALEFLKSLGNTGGKLTIEQEEKLKSLMVKVDPVEIEIDESTPKLESDATTPSIKADDVTAEQEDSNDKVVKEKSGSKKKVLTGVWAKSGGQAIVPNYSADDAFISIASDSSIISAPHPIEAPERRVVNNIYKPLPNDGSCYQPPIGRGSIQVVTIICNENKVLVINDGPANQENTPNLNEYDPEERLLYQDLCAVYAGRKWTLPSTEVRASESISEASSRCIAESCERNGSPLQFVPTTIASIEDVCSLRSPHLFRFSVVGTVKDLTPEELSTIIPEGCNFAWIPSSLLSFACPVEITNPDALLPFENISSLSTYTTILQKTVLKGDIPSTPLWTGASYCFPPNPESPGALAHHVVELALISAPSFDPADVHILLVRDGKKWALPSTHLDRGESITFAARRISRGGFGLVLNSFGCASVVGGKYSLDIAKQNDPAFSEEKYFDDITKSDEYETYVRGMKVPVSDNENENAVRGLRFTLAAAFPGCGPNAVKNVPSCLQGGNDFWPVIDTTMKMDEVPPHHWFSFDEMLSIPEEIFCSASKKVCLNTLANTSKTVQAGAEAANLLPTHLGLAALLNIDTLSAQNEQLEQ